jgi:hypothetical protein
MQWAWPMSRSEERWPNDDTVKRFYAVLGVVLGTIGTVGVSYAVGAGKASLGLVPAAVVGFLAWMIYTIRKRRGLPVVATDGTHLTVLVTSFWLLQVTLIPLSSFLTFGLLGFLLLALIIALGRIILYRNQWNLSAGHTLSTILLLTFVPAAWFLFEQFALEWLVKMRFFPAVAANLAGILIFAVLLRPVYHGIQWVVEWFSLKPLRPVISRMPELLESLIKSANDKDRADAIKELLQSDEIGLESFVLYSRWENPGGNLKHVLNTHLNYEPPDSLRLSKNLLDQLAREASFIVVRNALREARYAAMCPELWRLQRRLGYVPRSDEEKTWRCKYILPIAVGESLCGLLIVGDQAFPDHIRSESFVERLQNLGVAGV